MDYIKQIRLNDIPQQDAFPQKYPTDYLFGPIDTKIPWDSNNQVQWIGTKHHKYYDGEHYGIISFIVEVEVTNVTIVNGDTDAEINTNIPQALLLDNLFKVNNQDDAVQSFDIKTVHSDSRFTLEGEQSIAAGNNLHLTFSFLAKTDYVNQSFIIENKDLSGIIIHNNEVFHQYTFDANNFYKEVYDEGYFYETAPNPHINFDGVNSQIILLPDEIIGTVGIGAIMETGIVLEKAQAGIGGDNVIFYAIPKFYSSKKPGSSSKGFFNIQGGTSSSHSFFDAFKKVSSGSYFYKSTIEISQNNFKNLVVYETDTRFKEPIFVLALKRTEFDTLLGQTANFSQYHIKMCKLIPESSLEKSYDHKPYYKYTLTIAGLDTNGSFIETNDATGIEI